MSGRYGEISDGEIVMALGPVPMHAYIARSITGQLDAQLPSPLGAFENADTEALVIPGELVRERHEALGPAPTRYCRTSPSSIFSNRSLLPLKLATEAVMFS